MHEHTGYTERYSEEDQRDSAFWRWIETIAGALFSPSSTLREVGRREAIVPALLFVVFLVAVSTSGQFALIVSGYNQFADVNSQLGGDVAGSLMAFQIMGLLWNLISGPVFWTIGAGMLYGVAYLLGGRGRFVSLWAATGFALAPQLLIAPLAPVLEAGGVLGPGWQLIASLIAMPLYVAAAIWTIVLLTIAVRETMALSGGRAFASLAILVGGLLLLITLLVCAFLAVVFGVIAATT